MKETSRLRKIAFVGDHLPRKCGIATFTSDLLAAVASVHPQSQCLAVSVNDIPGGYEYPEVVRFEIEEQDLSSYLRAADFLNISNVDIVCLQHEFGIFGGPVGGHILAFLRELRMPVVTTLHTVLREPRADQRRVMQELISLSTRLVVMAERGRQMLQDIYQAPPGQDRPDPARHSGRGVCRPDIFQGSVRRRGQGGAPHLWPAVAEQRNRVCAQRAARDSWRSFPTLFISSWAPRIPTNCASMARPTGSAWRFWPKSNKVEKNVIFYNQFVDLENLKEFIGAADLYITPYLNEAQITSGTLAYAFGSGKAVVSTPYWHAAELLAEDRGVLVPFARRPGHRSRGDRSAARRHPPPCHAQERISHRPRNGVEQCRAAVYAFVRGIAAASERRGRENPSPPKRSTRSLANCPS